MTRRARAAEDERARDAAQLDYAWKWFSFHAEQRTKMFNYMLLGIGLVATAIGGALTAKLPLIAAVLSFVAALVANVFFLIDGRNRRLYDVALRVLIAQEKARLFGPDPGYVHHAIASRIQFEDTAATSGRPIDDLLRGRHRVWMPVVILGFAAMFAVIGGVLVLASSRGDDTQTRRAAAIPAACGEPACRAYSRPSVDGVNDVASVPIATKPTAPRSTAVTMTMFVALAAGLLLTVFAWRRLRDRRGGERAAIHAGAAEPSRPEETRDVTKADEEDRIRHTKGALALAGGGALLTWSGLAWLIDGGMLQISLAGSTTDRCAVTVVCCGETRPCVVGDSSRAQPMVLRAERFAGFDRGSASLDCSGPVHRPAIESVRETIRHAHGAQQDVLVMLVGGTDREPLSPALRRRYESNAGLARARVNAVEQCLLLADLVGPSGRPIDPVRVVSGPGYTPDKQLGGAGTQQQMAEDREVRVFVFGVFAGRAAQGDMPR